MEFTVLNQLFIILIAAGLFLVGVELFVPGGVLGAIGAVALIGAIIIAFFSFGPAIGTYTAVAIFILVGISIFLWAKYFPQSRLGRSMTVGKDLAKEKASKAGLEELIGMEGVATSELRPAGYAKINGLKVDVVAEAGMIDKGDTLKVTEIEGNRVVVRKIENKNQ